MLKNCLSVICVGLFAASISASADTIKTFTLNQNGCSSGCFLSPYGTITLDQNGTGVIVTETLFNGSTFAVTGAGSSLEFQLNGVFSFTGIPYGFKNGGAATASTFGSFNNSVDCTNTAVCPKGGRSVANGGNGGPLSFTVTGATIASFTANLKGYYFASDLWVPNVANGDEGNTGNVAAYDGTVTTNSTVPEPSSLILMGSGILGVAGAIRRRLAA
jgi:hypothetical protein